MANHCNNTFFYVGQDADKLREVIKDMIDYNKKEKLGAYPKGLTESVYPKFFFDVDCNESDGEDVIFWCWTKWSPPYDEFIYLTETIKGDWVMKYEELGCGIFGEMQIDKHGNEIKVDLDDEDFEAVSEDEDGNYRYKGEAYECDNEIYEMILENKLAL